MYFKTILSKTNLIFTSMKKITTILTLLVFTSVFSQIPSYVPTNGLVGYWPFNGNANDASGNNNNGIINGAALTEDRLSNSNCAFSFNGINNTINTNNFTNPLTDWSCSFWFLSNNTSTFEQQNIIGFGQNSPTFGGPCYQINGGIAPGPCPEINSNLNKMLFSDATSECGNILFSNQSVNNVWYFVTVKKQSTMYSIYVNGTLINSGNLTNITLTNLSFGNRSQLNFQYFDGKLDDIGLWNRALTQEEITGLYNATNTNECQTLVINTGILSFNPVTYNNTVTIYPNPANDHITIDCGNLANVTGYQIKIVNTLGQEVFSGAMNTQQYVVPLNTWSGTGVYFVKIYDASNNLLNTKKIILQ